MPELVITSGNWADEMDIEGFQLFGDGIASGALEGLKSAPDEFWANKDGFLRWFYTRGQEICIGTNEYVTFETFAEFNESIKIVLLSEASSDLLSVVFGVPISSDRFETSGFGINYLPLILENYRLWASKYQDPNDL